MVHTFKQVIDACGSSSALARELGMTVTAVQKWRDRDRIPAEHWLDVIKVARAKGFKLSTDRLAQLSAARKA